MSEGNPLQATQEALGATEDGRAVSLPTCAQNACTRRVEWRMTAVDADGVVLLTVLACNDLDHRGAATQAARRVCDGRVEIRKVEGE